jgi:hypothetical protein
MKSTTEAQRRFAANKRELFGPSRERVGMRPGGTAESSRWQAAKRAATGTWANPFYTPAGVSDRFSVAPAGA